MTVDDAAELIWSRSGIFAAGSNHGGPPIVEHSGTNAAPGAQIGEGLRLCGCSEGGGQRSSIERGLRELRGCGRGSRILRSANDAKNSCGTRINLHVKQS
jgi:hypothetical protein